MLVRQLFNHATFSYTYLLADPMSSDAVLIDPVKGKLREYVQLFNELGLSAVATILASRGGRISAESHSHGGVVQGNCVRVFLPSTG